MRLLQKIECDNHLGRIQMSANSLINPYLLYSQSCKEGILTIYDTHQQSIISSVYCHKTPILKMSINYYGNLVATCST